MTKYLRICLINRSFSQTLTLDYLDSPRVKIYVHDSAKDVFYELGNLEDIRDRSVLKVFEADSSGRGPGGLGPNGLPPVTNADEFLGGVPASQIRGHTSTLPRNTFSSLEQNDGGGIGNLRTGPGGVPPPTLGERSKTLGPGFMRSHRDRVNNASGGRRVESGYISSPDGNYEFDPRTASLPHHHVPHSRHEKPFVTHN